MDQQIERAYAEWSTRFYFDKNTRMELMRIESDENEIRDRFYKELEFGTAGIRGLMGAGTNRINIYVVRKVSYAIAKCLLQENTGGQGVVIGYDSRHYSKEFAQEAASVFAGHGIKVYLHPDICPVPVLSFSVRKLRCAAGIMITASHNPKEYNGYKVYGSDGAQLSPQNCEAIVAALQQMTDYTKLAGFDYTYFSMRGKIKPVDESVRNSYYKEVKKVFVNRDLLHRNAAGLKIVYTPLHGAGGKWVPPLLESVGFRQVSYVASQMLPDGDFPTVRVPNPEDPGAFELAIQTAKETGADLILATDPDADRTGAYAINQSGEYEMLNGNQIGAILLEHIITGRKEYGTLPENPFVVSTIVSTRLARRICEANGIAYTDVLTGFKYIGEQIVLREEQGDEHFLFGFEESYGYLAGIYARDKDSVASCALLAEAAAKYAKRNMSLFDGLEEIYQKYGYSYEMQVSVNLKGEIGRVKMQQVMETLRREKAAAIPENIVIFQDIENDVAYAYDDEGRLLQEQAVGLPKANVLYYELPRAWFCVRPSGTEPKIKIYFGAEGKSRMEAAERAAGVKEKVMRKITEIIKYS